jgi:hypothetical protein
MLVNIQQPLIREDGTVLLATDSKVMFSLPFPSSFVWQCRLFSKCTGLPQLSLHLVIVAILGFVLGTLIAFQKQLAGHSDYNMAIWWTFCSSYLC